MIDLMSVLKAQLSLPGTSLLARVPADRITWPGVPPDAPLSAQNGYTGVSLARSGGELRRVRLPLDMDRVTIRAWGTTHAEAETTYRALVDTLQSLLNTRVDLGSGASAILYLTREVGRGVHQDDPDTGNPLVQSGWEIGYWRNTIS